MCHMNTTFVCIVYFATDIEENEDFLEEWIIETPPNTVEDSARSWVTAVGDLLGPTLEVSQCISYMCAFFL